MFQGETNPAVTPDTPHRSSLPVLMSSPHRCSRTACLDSHTSTRSLLTAVTTEITFGLQGSELVNLTHQLSTELVPATGLSSRSLILCLPDSGVLATRLSLSLVGVCSWKNPKGRSVVHKRLGARNSTILQYSTVLYTTL